MAEVRTNEQTKTKIDFRISENQTMDIQNLAMIVFKICKYVLRKSKNVFNDILKSICGYPYLFYKTSQNTKIFNFYHFSEYVIQSFLFCFNEIFYEIYILALSILTICNFILCTEYALTRKTICCISLTPLHDDVYSQSVSSTSVLNLH